MKVHVLPGLFAIVASAVFAGESPGSAPSFDPAGKAPAIAWRSDYRKSLEEAHQSGKPLLIDFWATWCGPCKEMEAKLWTRADVIALAGKFVCLRVDIDRDIVTPNRYQNESVPTVLLADPWGTVLCTVPDGEGVALAELDFARLEDVRRRLPSLRHRRL